VTILSLGSFGGKDIIPLWRDAAANAALFREVSALGRTLIGLHTYGERLGGRIPRSEARNTVAVPTTPDGFSYDPQTRTLHVGATDRGASSAPSGAARRDAERS